MRSFSPRSLVPCDRQHKTFSKEAVRSNPCRNAADHPRDEITKDRSAFGAPGKVRKEVTANNRHPAKRLGACYVIANPGASRRLSRAWCEKKPAKHAD